MSTSIDKIEAYKLEEEAFRRGVAHGFEIAANLSEPKLDELREKIREWRYDLDNGFGPPGSSGENLKMYNPSSTRSLTTQADNR